MSEIKVSVVVPIYGVEKYLPQCIDSILAQTLKEIEIILVDDGSCNNCPAIVDEYAARDSRIIAVHQENAGYGRAVNRGIERAAGDYIAIVEPDDWIEPVMYEKLYSKAVCDDLDVVKSDFRPLNLAKRFSRQVPNKWVNSLPGYSVMNADEASYFFQHHPSIWSCIYRRAFLQEKGIRMTEDSGASWQDNLFQVQTLCLAKRVGFTGEIFYNYRVFSKFPWESLKNWRTPLKRIGQIHGWLKENGFDRAPFRSYLGLRELSYLEIVVCRVDAKDWPSCRTLISELAECLPIDEMLPLVPSMKRAQLRRKYELAKDDPEGLRRYEKRRYLNKRLTYFRKWLLSLSVRKGEVILVVAGHVFLLWKRKRT